MRHQKDYSELLKEASSGSLENTVDARTYEEIKKDLKYRDGPLLEGLLKGEVSTKEYLDAHDRLQKKAEQNAIIFDSYEQFEEFCYVLYEPAWAEYVTKHERKHASDIEQCGLSVRYGLIILNREDDIAFVLDNLSNIAVGWSEKELSQYLEGTSEIDGLDSPSDTDYSMYKLTRKYKEGLLKKIVRFLSLRPI